MRVVHSPLAGPRAVRGSYNTFQRSQLQLNGKELPNSQNHLRSKWVATKELHASHLSPALQVLLQVRDCWAEVPREGTWNGRSWMRWFQGPPSQVEVQSFFPQRRAGRPYLILFNNAVRVPNICKTYILKKMRIYKSAKEK